jgi:peptide/nickel transport system permease protein
MCKTVIRRLAGALLTLLCSTFVLFAVVRMAPGDPVVMMLWLHPGELPVINTDAYKEKVLELRAQYGLDKNIVIQYSRWVGRLLTFDLGISFNTGRAVAREIFERIPATVTLSVAAIIFQLILGILFGVLSAVKATTVLDNAVRLICVIVASTPAFVTGLVMLSIFALTFHVYEIGNSANLGRLWLPAITLGLSGLPQLTRMVRANLLSEFGQPYIASALSRGLSRKLVLKHAVKNALLPIITIAAMSFTNMIAGAVIIENIFSWPGIGNYAMHSILLHDYPVIQGYAIIMISAVIAVNLAVDLAYVFIDPQIRGKRRTEGGVC